jgi:hypothetical protein
MRRLGQVNAAGRPYAAARPRLSLRRYVKQIASSHRTIPPWPAPGSEDTELGVLMEPEVRHGAAEVYAGVQA